MLDAVESNPSETELLYDLARTLLCERDYGELLAALLDAAIEGFGADRGFVVVREDGAFRAAVSRNFKSEALTEAEEAVSNSISAAGMEQGRALVLDDARDSERF